MPRIFLFLSAIALLGFIISQNFWSKEKTWEPFYQGCMASPDASAQRCSCFTNYIHDHLSEGEVGAVMANRVAGASFQEKVEQTVRKAAIACH